MEITLTWASPDCFIESKSSYIISSLAKSNSIFSKLVFPNEYIITSQSNTSLGISTKTTLLSLPIDNNTSNTITLEIALTSDNASQVKNILKVCQEKELQLLKLKKEIKAMKEQHTLPSRIELKMLSLLQSRNQYYTILTQKIYERFLNYEEALKEIKEVQVNVMKFKQSKIITLYYKLAFERFVLTFRFGYKYGDYFIANEKTKKRLVEIYLKSMRFIIQSANEGFKEKLKAASSKYKDHIKDYENMFKVIEKLMLLFPIIKNIEAISPNVVFGVLDEPVKVDFIEKDFLEIKYIQSQIPSYNTMLSVFSGINNEDLLIEALGMAFERDYLIYKKYKGDSVNILYGYLLYEN